ncbi:MAG TPA: YHS domain-containing protein, partial [Vicinamibacterales bacterium]|nr:YHS domain-containing protein [Vicinamibacterales bacterium]
MVQAPGAIDPVCGMTVDPATAKFSTQHDGRTYYFCSGGCLAKFQADPAKYQDPVRRGGPSGPPSGRAAARPLQKEARPLQKQDVEYTCPMHPEVRQIGPGSCPLCGMALEPVEMTAEEPENEELTDMTRRFRASTALAVPVVLLAMSEMLPGDLAHAVSGTTRAWLQLALATPVVLWGGAPFFARGWQSIVNRSPNMFTLIALGVGVAWVYSVVATLVPGIFPPSFRMHDGSVGVYFEAAAVIVVLVQLGQVLELRARSQTGAAIRALLGLAPKTARRLRPDGTDEDVPLEHIHPGDRLRVRPGEKVPVDGVVLEGTSAVDEAMV